MDKSWMSERRSSKAYLDGVAAFIKFATEQASVNGVIYCPCRKCYNRNLYEPQVVHEHLLWNGVLEGYKSWVFHGETITSSSSAPTHQLNSIATDMHSSLDGNYEMQALLQDAFGILSPESEDNEPPNTFSNEPPMSLPIGEQSTENVMDAHNSNFPSTTHPSRNQFEMLVKENDQELYPGCTKVSRISFILRLYHLKCLNGWSGKSFTMLLELLSEAFPSGTSLPSSYYEAKKIIKSLGLGYEKIDACPNDCSLFWGDKEKNEYCNVCATSRWICNTPNDNESLEDDSNKSKKKRPAKVLRYFPLIPRLKRLFMSSKTAQSMRWHAKDRNKDGKLRHPADALAWKHFDDKYPDFASDPRSVRLGLASDGFNPFRTMSTTHSTWPVVLVPYNFEPWVCMKQSSMILSMVIPGEKGPGNDIDIFLQPLIEELLQLWDGVDAFDSYTGQNFKLRASLLWTINDFPAYANLSGWSTKGRVACPCCGESTNSKWLRNGRKFCYLGHRRWLDRDHPFRFQFDQFDGSEELETAPLAPSGTDILNQLRSVTFSYGKSSKTNKKQSNEHVDISTTQGASFEESTCINQGDLFEDIGDAIEDSATNVNCETRVGEPNNTVTPCLWKKKSIFFDLPYWEFNVLRHNLDVMHIEKNVCDNLISTFLNVDGKSKDNFKARLDLVDMGIRHALHPITLDIGGVRLPPASYTMTTKEKELFLIVLKNMKVPDGYASNISRCVNLRERKLLNLKSHDGHILMQDILPISLRACMPTEIVSVVFELSSFFKSLCCKILDIHELDQLQVKAAETLCRLEKIFPPSFFTIMVHLIVHLVAEVKLGGPVQYRWMYPIERDLMRLKSHVRNRAQPEGSIAEGYIADECLTFCSRYLGGVETRFTRPQRNFDHVDNGENYMFSTGGRVLGKIESIIIDELMLAQAHRYVLLHYDGISHYRCEFLNAQRRAYRPRRSNQRIEQKWLLEKFPQWLFNQVPNMRKNDSSEELISIVKGPNNVGRRFGGFIINGFRFHTKSRECFRKTQNSGVVVEVDGVPYYGKLTDIIEIDYYRTFKIVMFKCDWVDVKSSRGLKKDANGCTLVNFTRLIHTGQFLQDDPFVFSSQAKQVFYVQDPRYIEWSQVIHTKPRDLYEMGVNSQVDDDDTYTECMPYNVNASFDNTERTNWVREDIDEQN